MVKFVSQIDVKADEVYSWHQTFGANDRLTPPWLSRKLLRQEHNENETLQYTRTNSGIQIEKTLSDPQKRAIISEHIKSSQQSMQYIKSFNKLDNKTLIKETVSVNLFNSILPKSITEEVTSRRLEKEFHFRGKRIENDIKQHSRFANLPRKNIAILGASKSLANQFKPFFTSGNHNVFSLVKRKPYPTAREIQLNTNNGNVGLAGLKEIDTVIYFALGEKTSITEENFDKILNDKTQELRLLIKAFEVNKQYPESFTMMSSTCVYSAVGESITEFTPTKNDSKIAQFYLTLEKELEKLRLHGVRVTYARTGNILSARSGVLKHSIAEQKFAFCRQKLESTKYLNWVNLDDAIYATNHIIMNPAVFGPVNVCSSMSINANDLSSLLAEKTHRPFLFSLPKFLFKLFYGAIKQDQILQDHSVYPQKLKQFGFNFSFENIDDALNWETGNFFKPNQNMF